MVLFLLLLPLSITLGAALALGGAVAFGLPAPNMPPIPTPWLITYSLLPLSPHLAASAVCGAAAWPLFPHASTFKKLLQSLGIFSGSLLFGLLPSYLPFLFLHSQTFGIPAFDMLATPLFLQEVVFKDITPLFLLSITLLGILTAKLLKNHQGSPLRPHILCGSLSVVAFVSLPLIPSL